MSAQEIPLEAFHPDFVLDVNYPFDAKTATPTKNAQDDLKKLLASLLKKSFDFQIRENTLNSILVFVSVKEDSLVKYVNSSLALDYQYGITNDLKLLSSYKELEKGTVVSYAEKARIIYEVLTKHPSEGGAGITVGSGDWSFVKSITAVGNLADHVNDLKEYGVNLTKIADSYDSSSFDYLRSKFGLSVAFFFEFLSKYTNWLIVTSFVGILSHKFLGRYSLVFTIFNLLSSIAFYLYWYVFQSKLALNLHVRNISLTEPTNVSYLNALEQKRPSVPVYKTVLKELAFVPAALLSTGVLLLAQIGCFVIEIFLNEIYDGPFKKFLSFVPTALIVGVSPIIAAIYNVIIDRSLNWEQHPNNSSLKNSKLIKLFAFNFTASYVPLLISAFVYLPFGFKVNSLLPHIHSNIHYYVSDKIPVLDKNFEVNRFRLNGQFQYFILTNQIVALVLEFVVPAGLNIATRFLSQPASSDKTIEKRDNEVFPQEHDYLTLVRSYVALPEISYDTNYRTLIIQFGYLVLFGPAWSLGPIVSLIFIVARTFIYKFQLLSLKIGRVPIPERRDSIYPWDLIIRWLIVLSAVTSTALSLMYNRELVSSVSGSALGQIKWWKVVGITLFTEHIVSLLLNISEYVIRSFVASSTDSERLTDRGDVVSVDPTIRKELINKTVPGFFETNENSNLEISNFSNIIADVLTRSVELQSDLSSAQKKRTKVNEEPKAVSTSIETNATVPSTQKLSSSVEESKSNLKQDPDFGVNDNFVIAKEEETGHKVVSTIDDNIHAADKVGSSVLNGATIPKDMNSRTSLPLPKAAASTSEAPITEAPTAKAPIAEDPPVTASKTETEQEITSTPPVIRQVSDAVEQTTNSSSSYSENSGTPSKKHRTLKKLFKKGL
ncbi:ER-plasma membrane tethering protein [Komagataella phaffii CBS 7435]|uniref:Plasma membrane protein that may be involved in osmotolerance n=2 Tax=Komagataella phaffii TaxID=460519 RepID=C4R0V8_KOMPG|nr:Plasma membrane protein that may be involved in osmotolerance [Komagataella phaffii GS115]AOA62876.1 GQ67_00547T0 [Komagataella phaffii]CAH2448346.1 ER-plasma membrane tethering protein [Komagataella phaffii CBS 7435]AOA67526.1 GQ68_00841T0 [Komagataella phaffii GS115]CAY69132.1 Plasma membrane protein that may be involved in osmotolerance [Komagataella phaffii GS115]SCV12063.1 ER-plasma membrane tethering protein [Komagataella phaffii CBS 7435]